MKKMLFSRKYILIGLLVLIGASVKGEVHEMTKDMYVAFKVNENSKVEVENKYGDIFVETWDADSVAFEIEIVAYSEKEQHLENLIDMVEIDFNDYSSFIIARTKIGEGENILDKAAFNFSKKITGTREVRVNYRIFIPNNLTFSIENEFGDVFIDEYKGEFSLDLSHGDFRANLLSNVKSIKSKYGEVKIDEARGGRFDFRFVKEAELGILNDVFIKSSSSEIDIEEMDILRLESRLDEIYVENLGELSGKTHMTKLHIKHLNEKAELESTYGNVRVEDLMPTVTKVKMSGSNTDYELDFSDDTSGSFEIQVSSSKSFSSSKEKVIINEEIALDEKTNIYEGNINGSSGDLRVFLFTKNGNVAFGR